uniref:Uncharacterized protein n=1 Tax=Apteryx owenii TaxID=8824 RepID=A0A8B9PYJ5_APTOW
MLTRGISLCHYKVLCDDIPGITELAIPCLACCSGVKLISGLIYKETQGTLSHAKRKTRTAMDTVHALGCQGHTLYGF